MKYADLISAALDGKTIQRTYVGGNPYFQRNYHEWMDMSQASPISKMARDSNSDWSYRIKPEPKPDVVKYSNIYYSSQHDSRVAADRVSRNGRVDLAAVIKLTINGETGIKTVEIVE